MLEEFLVDFLTQTLEYLTQTKPYKQTLPPETAGPLISRIYWRTCQYPNCFISWGYREEYFFKFDMGKVLKRYIISSNAPSFPTPRTIA